MLAQQSSLHFRVLYFLTAVCIVRHNPCQCDCARIVCVVFVPFVFSSHDTKGYRYCCARPDGVRKALLLDALRFGVVAVGAGGGFVEKRRELCESTEMVFKYFGEKVFDGVEGQIVVSSPEKAGYMALNPCSCRVELGALWNVSCRFARCVVVCAMRGVTSVEEGHDVERVTETMRVIT